MRAVLASDAARLPEIARIRRRYAEDRFWRASPVITRAIERGELPPRTDPDEVLKTLIAPILLRLLFTAEPVDEATAHSYDRWACALTRRYLRAHRARTRRRVERAGPGRCQFPVPVPSAPEGVVYRIDRIDSRTCCSTTSFPTKGLRSAIRDREPASELLPARQAGPWQVVGQPVRGGWAGLGEASRGGCIARIRARRR
jgi:hypothetical protein